MFGESFGAGVGDAARDPADVEAANERATSILYQQAVELPRDVAAYVHAVRQRALGTITATRF